MAGRKNSRKKPSARPGISRKAQQNRKASFFEYFRFSESYTSLILGIIVVIIASVLLVSFLRGRDFGKTSPAPEISSISTGPDELSTTPLQPIPQLGGKGTYTVQPGDDLWHIAEKVYKDGYKWTRIAKENNITNPGMIFSGNVLKIPDVNKSPIAISQQPPRTSTQAQQPAIVGNRYVIRHGDTLWSIAQRRYNNGYRWVDIAKVNNLTNPNLIHGDNVLQLPQ